MGLVQKYTILDTSSWQTILPDHLLWMGKASCYIFSSFNMKSAIEGFFWSSEAPQEKPGALQSQ